jgi:paraquat-inducible protein A
VAIDHPNQTPSDATLVACPNCDLLQRLPEIAPGEAACCPRCGTEMWRRRKDPFNRTLALAIAALVLWIITNTMPMLGLTAAGHVAFTTVIGGAELLWEHGQPLVAAVIFFTVVFAPILQIGIILLVSFASLKERPAAWVGWLLRHVSFLRIWSMMEVLLVGVLVSLTKIAEYATVLPGHALFTIGGLVVVLAMMQSSFDTTEVWRRVAWARDRKHEAAAEPLPEVAS